MEAWKKGAVIILILIAWSPWITRSYAENKVVEDFEEKWEGIIDGCGFDCIGCGVTDSKRTLFGYVVIAEFACGMLPEDSPEYHVTGKYFVSFLGIIVNLENVTA
jgi:hypothetical protein